MLKEIQEYDRRHRFLSMSSREKSCVERAEFCLFMMMLFDHVDKNEVRDLSDPNKEVKTDAPVEWTRAFQVLANLSFSN